MVVLDRLKSSGGRITLEDLLEIGIYTEEDLPKTWWQRVLATVNFGGVYYYASTLEEEYRLAQYGTTLHELSLEYQEKYQQQQAMLVTMALAQLGYSATSRALYGPAFNPATAYSPDSRLDVKESHTLYGKTPARSWYTWYGDTQYPPNMGAVPGTEHKVTLHAGHVLGRYGKPGKTSHFATQAGVDSRYLSLPPHTNQSVYIEYRVVKDIGGVSQSQIAPWGESVGLGLQYDLPRPIIDLIKDGYIIEIIH